MRISCVMLVLSLLLFGCQQVDSNAVEESIILAGDAGNTNFEAVNTLAQHARVLASKTSIYLLGDNIYNAGLPNVGHPNYEQARERLNRQIHALKGTASKIVFVPGNHDWDNTGPMGYQYIKNQEKAVLAALGEGNFAPSQGCPGPVMVEERSWVKVVVIDSHWWLHPHEKPSKQSDGCPTWNEEAVLAKIKEELTKGDSKKPVIFLQHHPLESVGKHAKGATCYGDMVCPRYQEMRTKLLAALNVNKPLVCAAGHDHSLQHLIGGFGCKNFVVSGSMSSPSVVFPDNRTKYASQAFGFFRIDFLKNKKIRLQSIEVVNESPHGRVAYQVIL